MWVSGRMFKQEHRAAVFGPVKDSKLGFPPSANLSESGLSSLTLPGTSAGIEPGDVSARLEGVNFTFFVFGPAFVDPRRC